MARGIEGYAQQYREVSKYNKQEDCRAHTLNEKDFA
jgi:hypothetical protein